MLTLAQYTERLQDLVTKATAAASGLLKVTLNTPIAVPVVDVTEETLNDVTTAKKKVRVSGPKIKSSGIGRTERNGRPLLNIPASWICYRTPGDAPETLATLVAGILSTLVDSKLASAMRADLMILANKESGGFRFNPPAGFDLPPNWTDVLADVANFPAAEALSLLAFKEVKPPTRVEATCPGDPDRDKPARHFSAMVALKYLPHFAHGGAMHLCPVCQTPLAIFDKGVPYAPNTETPEETQETPAEAEAA